MTKKSFVIILILSVVATYGAAIFNDMMNGSVVGGKGGIPFTFASGSSTNGILLAFDIIFWFIVIIILWKILLKILQK